MHSNMNNQPDLLPRRSPWNHPSSDPIRPSAFYSKVLLACASPAPNKTHHLPSSSSRSGALHCFLGEDDPVLSSLVPSVTVVLEGRSICHRINLSSHESYASLARELRGMFGSDDDVEGDVELGNAVPGHVVAYEDAENDLLLAGDLSWSDFVRFAKRIRILPVKQKSKKPTSELKKSFQV